MNPATQALYQQLSEKMHRAFKLVEPKRHWKD